MKSRSSWLWAYLSVSFIWGFSFLFMKVGLESFSPFQVAFLRISLGALVLSIVLLIRKVKLTRDRTLWFHTFVAGLLLNAIPFSLYCFGEQRVSSSLAGILNAATPLFTVIIAPLMISSEKPSGRRVFGLGISFVGVITVFGVWSGGISGDLTGALLCLGAPLCYGFGSSYVRKHISNRIGILEQSVMQLLCASLILVPFEVIFYKTPHDLAISPILAILSLGILGSGLANLMMNIVYRDAGPTIASTVTYVIPIISTSAGVIILKENVAFHEIIGAAVIIGGLLLTQQRVKRGSNAS